MVPCYAQQSPAFLPARRIINSISQSSPATVTTSFDHDYETGTIVRLYINPANGMTQLQDKIFPITVTSATTFTIPTDTRRLDPFVVPGGLSRHVQTCAYIVPVGSVSGTDAGIKRNVLT